MNFSDLHTARLEFEGWELAEHFGCAKNLSASADLSVLTYFQRLIYSEIYNFTHFLLFKAKFIQRPLHNSLQQLLSPSCLQNKIFGKSRF